MKTYEITKELRLNVLEHYNFTCQECKRSNVKLDVHHIIPRQFNGKNDFDNLIPLCRSCHRKIENSIDKTQFKEVNLSSSTVIRVTKSTQKRLMKFGKMGDNFDILINRLLDELESYSIP